MATKMIRIICRKTYRFFNPNLPMMSVSGERGEVQEVKQIDIKEGSPIDSRPFFDTTPGANHSFGDPQNVPEWIRIPTKDGRNVNTFNGALKAGDLVVIGEVDAAKSESELAMDALLRKGYTESAAKEILMKEGTNKVLRDEGIQAAKDSVPVDAVPAAAAATSTAFPVVADSKAPPTADDSLSDAIPDNASDAASDKATKKAKK